MKTDRQTDRPTDRQADRQTPRQASPNAPQCPLESSRHNSSHLSSRAHPSVVDFVLKALDAVSKVSRIDSSNNIGRWRRSERRRR